MEVEPLRAAASGSGKLVGAAVPSSLLGDSRSSGVLSRHFNYLTAEYEMKWGAIEATRGQNDFGAGDAIVSYGQAMGMQIKGHALIWHNSVPGWVPSLSPADLRVAFEIHIRSVAEHFRGRVRAWDVVNEAINDGGTADTGQTENLRNSQWMRIMGPEFLTFAFKFAHEADPDARLYYNDYNIESGFKHESSMVLLKRLIKDGAPIHGVGIQGHWSTANVPYAAIDKAIADYASLGLRVSITELDVTIRGAAGGQLGAGGRRGGGTPPSPQDLKAQADAYARLFAIFNKHKDKLERVTFWGLSDRRSWRAGQNPLIFDANNQRKPAYAAIVDALLRPNPDLGPPR
jgi:GH35 family endo-1,4-beta-xylanase